MLGAGVAVGVFFAGMIIIALILSFIVMPLIVKEGSEARIPDVTGLSLQAAEAKLNDAGLGIIKGNEEYDQKLPMGSVISQRPEGGATVKTGRRVILVISKGSASATVPKLEGYSLREARFLLEKEGLGPGEIIWLYDESRPDGVILATAPEEGTVMKLNADVQLMVNRKEAGQLVTVPNFIERDLGSTYTLAEENFLLIGELGYEVNNDLLPETVIRQSIPPGDKVAKWTVIDLTVSTLE
jgi:serine/threonine-protein kinase